MWISPKAIGFGNTQKNNSAEMNEECARLEFNLQVAPNMLKHELQHSILLLDKFPVAARHWCEIDGGCVRS